MFTSLSDRLTATFKNLRDKGKLSEADIDGTVREIRRALLDADVAVPVVRAFVEKVKTRALGEEVSKALNPAQQVVKIVHEALIHILGSKARRLQYAKNPPTVLMLAGLQGAGKTTCAGKLAHWFKSQGHTPLLVACDLQRPNAVTQLQIVGQRANVPVFAPHPGTTSEFEAARDGNPVLIASQGVEEAKAKHYDVVIVDTAGRLGVDQEMMQQATNIRDAINAEEILFVIDAMIGQDAVNTAKAFSEGVNFTGVVLTKMDGDVRGGAALSVTATTGRPIMFASTGENLEDFEVFHPDRMASRILDMGDILTLIEQAQQNFDAKEADRMAEKLAKEETFDLEDFLSQMQQFKKMGSMKKLMGMMPGAGAMKQQIEQVDEREIVRVEAIIRSMTVQERKNPKIINGSRRLRIAQGAGVTVSAINKLMKRFNQAQKMMRQMHKGGSIPGLGGMPGVIPRKAKGKKGKNKKAKSGNPAKRAQQEQEMIQKKSAEGSSFGQLPKDFKSEEVKLPQNVKNFFEKK